MQTTRMFSRTAIAALALASLAACAKSDDAAMTTTTDSTTVTTAPAPPPPPAMTDANIVAGMMTADSMEVALGTAMKTMGADAGVKSMGAMMAADHGKHMKSLMAMAMKDSIAPMAMSDDTMSMHMMHMQDMMKTMKKGMSSDSAMVAEMIAGHEAVLANLDKAEGVAQNAMLKDMVTATKPVVQKHLDAAKALQDKMMKAMTTMTKKTTTTTTGM